ncbi:hypothetical protein P3X46_019808 [Hevea brasiliensis]|uniref:K Homology domain-containing protein n=1 Tax=Hevea brasiliensis TaxID=3981 RepID=A0ABQ9LLU3_HEVBR|nr:hypothetical protein P3X46_019808 [Hevea brasiliensis]
MSFSAPRERFQNSLVSLSSSDADHIPVRVLIFLLVKAKRYPSNHRCGRRSSTLPEKYLSEKSTRRRVAGFVPSIRGNSTVVQVCEFSARQTSYRKILEIGSRFWLPHHCQMSRVLGLKIHKIFKLGRQKTDDKQIYEVGICSISCLEKEEVRVLLRQDPNFWTYRPLSQLMIRAAADDMMKKLNQRLLWYLAVRGALCCRCFCINDNDFADWPSVPPNPDNLIAEGGDPEEEILSVLDVPPGRMGQVIGKRGASILSCSNFFGGSNGPPDEVFIVGPVKQVRKAEAMLRGTMLEMF